MNDFKYVAKTRSYCGTVNCGCKLFHFKLNELKLLISMKRECTHPLPVGGGIVDSASSDASASFLTPF